MAAQDLILKKRRQALETRAKTVRDELLQDPDLAAIPEAQATMQNFVDDVFCEPGRIRVDARLKDLSTEELALHLLEFLNELNERAFDGDGQAIKEVTSIASNSAFNLTLLEKIQPEAIREIAQTSVSWPILPPGDERAAISETKRALELGIGGQFAAFRSKFHQLNGANDHRPNRLWAQKAVRTVELRSAGWHTLTEKEHSNPAYYWSAASSWSRFHRGYTKIECP